MDHIPIISMIQLDFSTRSKTEVNLRPCTFFFSLTVIMRLKDVDVAVEDMRLIILVHEKDGKKFLWPVLRQRPSADNIEGLLGE